MNNNLEREASSQQAALLTAKLYIPTARACSREIGDISMELAATEVLGKEIH
jgi:hypothetical protein